MNDQAIGGDVTMSIPAGWSRGMAERAARSIAIAHEINPNSWCINPADGMPFVVVGAQNILSLEGVLLVTDEAFDHVDVELLPGVQDTGRQFQNNPWSRYLRIEPPHTDENLGVLSPYHEEAVARLATQVRTKSTRWRWHADDFRVQVNQLYGLEIPEPAFLEELRRLPSSEYLTGSEAGQGEPGGVGVLDLTQTAARQMARTILAAHGLSPNCWALFITKKRIALMVGNVIVGGSGVERKYDFVVDRALLNDEIEAEMDTIQVAKIPKNYQGLSFPRLPDTTTDEQFGDLAAAHAAALSVVTNPYKRAVLWQNHDDALRKRIEEMSGIALPQPGYLGKHSAPQDSVHRQGVSDSPSLDHVEGRQYWRIDAGTRGKYWPALRDLGVAAHENWSSEPIHLDQLPEDHEGFVAAIIQNEGIAVPAANHCWQFMHEMTAGDLAMASNGDQVYGWGEIIGGYSYDAVADGMQHQRPAEWQELKPPHRMYHLSQGLEDVLRLLGPRKLTFEQFLEALGHSSNVSKGTQGPEVADVKVHIQAKFAATGLHYTKEQIAAFYTALQTKGFVVLSGISGTGKSKIATGFVEMLPSESAIATATEELNDTLIRVAVSRTTQNSGLVNFPIRLIEQFPAPGPGERLRIPVRFGDVTQDCLLNHITDRGSLYRLYFSGQLRRKIVALPLGTTLHFRTLVDESALAIAGFEIFLEVPADERQLLPEITELPKEPRNHLFLSVRPDWRDSTSLLGYYNPLTKTYEWTDFLRFLIRAGENFDGPEDKRIAWFVILDEMNLAHVEYYFADLLSVIESGRDEKGWTREPLRLSYPEVLGADDVPERELKLPSNLYIIGTVNMDETTHAFSPKVLDRAFTIELTDVDFADYPPPMTAGSGALSDGEKTALLTAFSRNGRFARIDKTEISEFVGRFPEVRDQLQALNEVLMPYRMHFGYRVFDEIVQYLAINDENGMAELADAFDQAVFMKVLPKFTGSRARLQSPLRGVFAWALDPDRTGRTDIEAGAQGVLDYESGKQTEAWGVTPVFPLVAARVRDMLVALERDGFVSFG